MKNVVQTVAFPAASMSTTDLSQELKEKCIELVMNKDLSPEDMAAKRKELAESLPEKLQQELNFYGAQLPTDKVQVSMKLGTLLFDAYAFAAKEPTAPLAKHLHQKRMQELAQTLDSDEFTIPEWATTGIKATLNNDEVWSKIQLTAWIETGETDAATNKPLKRFFTLNSSGANFFHNVLTAAAENLGA